MSYWGPLEGEPLWLKAVAWAVKPGLFLAIIAFAGWHISRG